jgi:hypothetical protein
MQMVKLWGPRGDMLAYRRSSAGGGVPLRSTGAGNIAWHPYKPIFACGGAEPVVKIYEVRWSRCEMVEVLQRVEHAASLLHPISVMCHTRAPVPSICRPIWGLQTAAHLAHLRRAPHE